MSGEIPTISIQQWNEVLVPRRTYAPFKSPIIEMEEVNGVWTLPSEIPPSIPPQLTEQPTP